MDDAVRIIEADFNRSADTHLLRVPLPGAPGIALYLKDESTHPTGSLKHRLARSLFLYGLCNGWIGPGTTIVEASSGSTAVSEAYFARMLGLRFIAVMPRSTSSGEDRADRASMAARAISSTAPPKCTPRAPACAESSAATTWTSSPTPSARPTGGGTTTSPSRSSARWRSEQHPVPAWIVVGAGHRRHSATIGRYIRYRRLPTRLCRADPEASAFFHRHWPTAHHLRFCGVVSVEGIGRPRCEPSFIPELIDRVYPVPDPASIASARVLSRRIGRSCGGSTGTNLWAVAKIVADMADRGERGSVVTLLCDSGERYRSTLLDDAWLKERAIDIRPAEEAMERFFDLGVLSEPPRD